MPEEQPRPIHHVQLGPGEAVVISAPVPDLGTYYPDLNQQLHSFIKRRPRINL